MSTLNILSSNIKYNTSSAFFDFEHLMRTNKSYSLSVERCLMKYIKTNSDAKKHNGQAKYVKIRDEAFNEFLKLTNFNITPLLGYFFPRYPTLDPFSLKDYPFAHVLYNLNLGGDSSTVIKGSRQISKTTNDGVSMRVWSYLLPGLRLATIVPRSEQLKTLGDKYQEVANAFKHKTTSSKHRENLYYKEYPSPSGRVSVNRLWYILTNPDKIRGNTYDWLYFDEYQDFDMSLEPQIIATQSQSTCRSIRYSGTSKSTDTALETRFLQSSRGYWRMTCTGCRHDNYPSINYDVFKMIQPKGLCCAKCGKELSARNGQWEFEAPELLPLGKWGFHIPQIIVPANTENKDKWLNIYKASQYMDKKSFLEEYLGEATEAGSKELTSHDLQSICILGDMGKLQRESIETKDRRPKYLFKISAVDWGGADYNQGANIKASATAHTIIGITPDRKFDLLMAKTYMGMGWDEISHNILADHRKFRCYAMANDHGGGAVYVNELMKLMDATKLVSFDYTGPSSALLALPKRSNYPNVYMLNRTESITALILDIKNKRLRAPRWEHISDKLLQCLNLIRVPYENQNGATTLKYTKNPSKYDDILHSLNIGVILAKILLEEQIFQDEYSLQVFNNYVKLGKPPSAIKAIRQRIAPVGMG